MKVAAERRGTKIHDRPKMEVVDLLTHPVMVVSVVLLVVNDHWAKEVFANHLTGKLSDATGSLVLAGLLAAVWSVVVTLRRRGQIRNATVSPQQAWLAVVAVVVGVTIAKTSVQGAHLAAWVLGAARWPLQAALGFADGIPQSVPALRPVVVVADATDVAAALFAVLLVWMVQRSDRDRWRLPKLSGVGREG